METNGHEDYIISLQDRIRNAYRRIGIPGQWVSLTRLRPEVGGYREFVDEALRRLAREEDVVIVPENNQKTLTQADRDAALWMGDQWKHLISIDFGQR